MSRQTLEKIILLVLFCYAFYLLIDYNLLKHYSENQFVSLAQSFLHGHLYLGVDDGSWLDASYYHGYAYWPQGVFPAVVLYPFIAIFGNAMQQGYIQFILNLLNIFLLYKIALKITSNKKTSLWLSLAYLFATAYIAIGLTPWSWWFAQVVETSAILLAIYEYLYQKRWILIGLYVACALATRIDLVFASVFFTFAILFAKDSNLKKAQNLCWFATPILVAFFLLFLYNYYRFGSVLEFGYTYHIPELVTTRALLKTYGPWNIYYFPTNFYYLFVKGFDQVILKGTGYLSYPFIVPDIWGMSILITSPIFLWCLRNVRTTIKEQEVRFALIAGLVILLFILGYFGIGTRQYGYRYALDFTPFLFLVLCYATSSGMSKKAKAVVLASFLFNAYFFPFIFSAALR